MNQNNAHPKISYSINSAVIATGFSRSRIYKFISRGHLKPFKVGTRTFISHDALAELVKKADTGAFADEA